MFRWRPGTWLEAKIRKKILGRKSEEIRGAEPREKFEEKNFWEKNFGPKIPDQILQKKKKKIWLKTTKKERF